MLDQVVTAEQALDAVLDAEDPPSTALKELFARPSSARVTDALRGGYDNFQADRDLCEQLAKADPLLPHAARALQRHAVKASEWAAGRGIVQYLDLGCGLPYPGIDRRLRNSTPALHAYAVLAGADPARVRITYVDTDPVVISHANALLDDGPAVRVLRADLLDMQTLLTAEKVNGHLDSSLPIAVSLNAVLHWITDDDAVHHALDQLTAWLAPGSAVSLTHAASDYNPAVAAHRDATSCEAGLPLRSRSRDEVGRLLTGLDLYPPGLADVTDWWNDDATGPLGVWAALGIKPGPRPDRTSAGPLRADAR
ncbi:SAM-dependent methyltransferase [Kitasatospora sp. NPDC048545]|uniref:SAM-dependent methyltransferase n=1 Tax=Kitasatospora sp. NPDC048545 TaxID=3157208 RepID=UPI0033D460CA